MLHQDQESYAPEELESEGNPADQLLEDDDASFEGSFLPPSQEETQVQSNRHKAKSSGTSAKQSKQRSKDAHNSFQHHRHSQRGVLSDIAAHNRHNRRVENSANMAGSAGRRGKSLEKQLEDQIQCLKAQMEENERKHQLALAQAKISAPKSKSRRGKKNGFGTNIPISTELQDRIRKVAGHDLWRTCKFLASEEQLDEACEIVMGFIPELADLVSDENPDKEQNVLGFSDNYGETICKVINTKRGEVQSGLKKAYEIRVAAGLSVPTPKELAQVIRRKGLEFDPEDPNKNAKNRDWFMWYWEHLLSKVGGKNKWGHTIRCYGTISKHAPPDDPKRKYITSSDEALVLVLYENCGQRFPYTAECAAKNQTADKSHPRYQSKWSDSRAGQCKWGGWNLEGRKRYIELRDKISKAKRKEHVAAVEAHVLSEIQAKYKIGTKPAARKKGPNPKDFEGKEEGYAPFGVESDEETEGEVEGQEEEEVNSDFEELDEEYQAPPPKRRRTT